MQFVGGAEPVKAVQKGNSSLKCCQVGHRCKVHHFLDAAAEEYGSPCLAAGIYIGVIAKDGQGMGGDSPGCHMDYPGKEFPCHTVEIRQHQQKALGGSESSGQRSRKERPVHGPCSPGLRLELGDGKTLSVYVFPVFPSPLVAEFCHGGGGGDGVDGGHLAVGIGYMGCRLVAVKGLGGAAWVGRLDLCVAVCGRYLDLCMAICV